MQAVQAAQATLDDFDTLPPLGQDAVSMGWRIGQGSAAGTPRNRVGLAKPEQILRFVFLSLRPLRPGVRTRWMNQSMRSTPR